MSKALKNLKKTTLVILVLILLVIVFWGFRSYLKKQFVFRTTPTETEQLTPGFPQLPIYPDARLVSSSGKTPESEFEYKAIWEIDKPVTQIVTWYIDELEKTGWVIDIKPADPQAEKVQLLVAKREELILNLSVIRRDDYITQIVSEFSSPFGEDYNEENGDE